MDSSDLSSYVPRLLAERLATDGQFGDFEWAEVEAAVLLTDIAGFTARVESVTSSPAGLEELARSFNAYFSDLVGLVYGHGGDVLAIAGDAFFSCWPVSAEQDLETAVVRAAQAGLAIQKGLEDVGGPQARHSFRTRIGISAGGLRVAFVGGVGGRWELMPVGTPLADVARAEQGAPSGSVVLAEPAWRAVASRCHGRDLGGGLIELTDIGTPVAPAPAAWLTSADPPEDLLGSYVPLPVRQQTRTADTEWLQELRRVTVVMVSVPDLADPESEHIDSSHLAVRAFQETMARFEGAGKLLVDNKGVTMSGVFGLPPRAHQDDPQRGIRAAESLREELTGAGLRSAIGIATGRAFCGVFGSDLRREYTMHGEVVTLAARLMQASTGDILVDGNTTRAARDSVSFDTLEPLSVKGRAEPVEVHRLSGLRAPSARGVAPIVGRQGERELLAERIGELADGRIPGTVVIEADAGLGKSRLAAEAAQIARAAEMPVLTAAADAVERATGYFAWRGTFADLLGEDAAESEIVRELSEDAELGRMLPLLNRVVPTTIPDNELTASMPGDVRADNTKALLAEILARATASSPALLIVEDAHWFDSNSWALLLEVVQAVPTLFVVITTRPMAEAPPLGYQRLLGQGSTRVLRLSALDPRETRALVAQRLGVRELPPALAGFVEARVAGHPFFCEELVQTMREAGILRVHDGTVVVGDLDGVDVPATIEGAVLSRLDRLSSGELLCIKVAAVIGRTFLMRTVGQALPVEEERAAVLHHLQTLTRLDLTLIEAPEPDRSYMFRHEITRDVAYELLTLAQRRQLHRAVAEWHESTYSAAELAPHYALLAHHWSRAEDPEKAVNYLERAGEQALAGGAFREALLFLSEAIEVQERTGLKADPVRRALCEKGMGTAHYFLGDLEQSRALLHRAVFRLDHDVPTEGPKVVRGVVAAAVEQLAHLARPSRYLERRASEKELLDEALGCYRILGQIAYLDGEPTPNLLYSTLAGVNLGEEAGPSPHLARMLIHAAVVTSLMGLNAAADRYAARAIEMTDHGPHTEAGAYVWSIYALIWIQRGDFSRARHANQRALERIREVGDFNLEFEVWQTRSALNICSGNFGEAEAAWARTRDLAKRKGNPQGMCWSLLDEVETRVGRGEDSAAARALDAALAIPVAGTDGGTNIEIHFATALVRARQGRFDEAIAAADEVVGMVASRAPTGFHWADFCASAVGVYLDVLERGKPEGSARAELEKKAARGCKVVRKVSRQFGNVRARRWLLSGLLAWERGNADSALADLRRAEETAARMDMPFERARARYEIARRGGAGAERASYLEDAARTFRSLGAGLMLARVREAQGL